MDRPLTPKQKRVLDAIRTYSRLRGYMPSVRDLAKLTNSAIGTVHEHLVSLKHKGRIRSDGSARGLQLVGDLIDRDHLISVPVTGIIAAGEPIEELKAPEISLTLQDSVARSGAFALRVKGNSMVDDHIVNGDLLIITPQLSVDSGEVAVALLDDNTATLKRIFKERSRIRLQPANSTMKPLFAEHLRIQGKVTAMLRLHKD